MEFLEQLNIHLVKDEEAPIFEIEDISIVGNVTEILPVMIEEMKKVKEEAK